LGLERPSEKEKSYVGKVGGELTQGGRGRVRLENLARKVKQKNVNSTGKKKRVHDS